MKIQTCVRCDRRIYIVQHDTEITRKNKSFQNIIDCLNYACGINEYILHIDPIIIDYIERTHHPIERKGGYAEFVIS